MYLIPERAALIIQVVINVLFICVGIGMIAFGASKNATAPKKIDGSVVDNLSGNWWDDGTLNILAGTLDFLVGVSGLIGAILKLRVLVITNVALLSLGILGNLAITVATPVIGIGTLDAATKAMRDSVAQHYGSSDGDNAVLTKNLLEHQKTQQCCGWSGRAEENVFLSTPWYKLTNVDKSVKPVTLPDTCCIAANDDCRKTENIKDARDKGLVYKMDCMEKLTLNARRTLWTAMVHLILTMVMQIAVVTFTVITLVQDQAPGSK